MVRVSAGGGFTPFLLSLCAAGAFFPAPARAQAPREAYTTNFRPGHNLSALISLQQTSWEIKKAGAVENVEDGGLVPSLSLRYAFHLNLVRQLGMVVGTATQVNYEDRDFEGFRPGHSVIFPSITSGLVQNFTSDTRLLLCAEYSAVWYPYMTTLNTQQQDTELGAIPDTISAFAQIDSFFSKSRAFTTVLGYRRVWNQCLGTCKDTNTLLGSLKLESSGWYVQTGMTWQLGDELR